MVKRKSQSLSLSLMFACVCLSSVHPWTAEENIGCSIILCLVPLRQGHSLDLELAVFGYARWPVSPRNLPVPASPVPTPYPGLMLQVYKATLIPYMGAAVWTWILVIIIQQAISLSPSSFSSLVCVVFLFNWKVFHKYMIMDFPLPTPLCWITLFQLDTSLSYLKEGNLNWNNASLRPSCGAFS